MLMRPGATHQMAMRLQEGSLSLGEAFAFMSGLYFRGKLAYSLRFARRATAPHGVLVIAPGLGLVPPETVVDLAALRRFAEVGVSLDEPRFREPFARDAAALASAASTSLSSGASRASPRRLLCRMMPSSSMT